MELRLKTRLSNIFNSIPDTLVIGPGGVKGAAKLGVLVYLEQIGKLNPSTLIGCSIGSILCLLLTVGYKPSELIPIMYQCYEMLGDCFDMLNIQKYILNINNIHNYIAKLIRNKLSYVPPLAVLYSSTNKHYISVAYNPIKRETVYIDHISHPKLGCVDAAIHSARIPLIFQEGILDDQIFIDGALGDPLPISHVDRGTNFIFSILGIEDILNYSTPEGKIKTLVDIIVMPKIESSYNRSGKNVDHVIIKCNPASLISLSTSEDSISTLNRLFVQGYNHFRYAYEAVVKPKLVKPVPKKDKHGTMVEYIQGLTGEESKKLLLSLLPRLIP